MEASANMATVKAKTVLAAVGAKMTVVAVIEMLAVVVVKGKAAVAVKEKAAAVVEAKTAAGRCVCSLFKHTIPLLRMKMRRTCFGASSPW